MRVASASVVIVALALIPVVSGAPGEWEARAPMPVPRTEVVAATVGAEIIVLGGFTADRGASRRADAYSPSLDRWRRLPDLPVGIHHAMAVGSGGKLYVLGGYTVAGVPLRQFLVFERGRWRALLRELGRCDRRATPLRPPRLEPAEACSSLPPGPRDFRES